MQFWNCYGSQSDAAALHSAISLPTSHPLHTHTAPPLTPIPVARLPCCSAWWEALGATSSSTRTNSFLAPRPPPPSVGAGPDGFPAEPSCAPAPCGGPAAAAAFLASSSLRWRSA